MASIIANLAVLPFGNSHLTVAILNIFLCKERVNNKHKYYNILLFITDCDVLLNHIFYFLGITLLQVL